MNIDTLRIHMRERTWAESIDLGILWVREDLFGPFLRLWLALVLPTWALTAFAGWWYSLPFLAPIIAVVWGAWIEGAFTILTSRSLIGESVRQRDVLGVLAKRALSWTWVRFCQALLTVIGTNTFIAPMVVQPLLFLTGEAFWMEHATPGKALVRSTQMVSPRMGSALLSSFGLLFMRFMIAFAVGSMLFFFLTSVLMLPLPGDYWRSTLVHAVLSLGWLVGLPWSAACRVVIFLDTRTRVDGLDLQLRMAKLAKERRDS